jgi:mannose/fructose/N-acetylgalactosamine-specific phosphotransferase system component IIC
VTEYNHAKERKIMKKLQTLALSGLAVVSSAVAAFAAPIMDFSAMTASVTEEITPAITAALPIAGTILAAGIAVKLYKRFVK